MPAYFENKGFKYLVIGLSAVAIGILVYELFFSPKMPTIPNVVTQTTSAKIDFKLLDALKIETLQTVDKIVLPETIGRENPFAPY